MQEGVKYEFDDAAGKPPKKWGQIPKRDHGIPKEDGRKMIKAAGEGDIAAVTALIGKYGKEILEVKERDWGVYKRDHVTLESDSFTPLMCAINGKHRALVTFLLDHGADVNARFDKGQTVLMLGLDEDDSMADLLLDRGADIHARTDEVKTSLMWPQTADSVRYLLLRGADVHARNNEGKTALMLVSCDTYLHRREKPPSSVLEALLDAGADINAHDNKCRTALMIAANRAVYDDDTPDKLECLLRRGANPLLRDDVGKTASMVALRPRPDLDGDKPRQKLMGEWLLRAEQEWQVKQAEACTSGSSRDITVSRPLQYRKPSPSEG